MTNWDSVFLFARAPDSGIDGALAEMAAAGFSQIYVNVRDYPENRWARIRSEAEKAGMVCGPWARTAKGPEDKTWAPEIFEMVLLTGDRWGTPSVPNCESEIDHSGKDITSWMRDTIGSRKNVAISTLARPMQAVDWRPIADIPILIQLFVESHQTDPMNVQAEWFNFGIQCVYGTYGSYGGRQPAHYPLDAPYSVYTADDIAAGNFSRWSPITFGYKPCKEEIPVPPTPDQYPWKKSYPRAKNAPVGPSELPRPVYPPDAEAKGKEPSEPGPDIAAYKRAMKRGQQGARDKSFSQLDDAYGNNFAHGGAQPWPGGIAGFQRCQQIDDTGWIGDKTYQAMRYAAVPSGPNKGQPLFDEKCLELLRQAQKLFRPEDDETVIRKYITEFLSIAEANEDAWHYSQNRPVKVLVDPDATSVTSDCSGYVIQAYAYAKAESGLPLKDPAKQNWSGFGNTGEFEDDWPRITSGQFLTGDLAHYNGHVTICKVAGSPDTAKFSSHGQEAGPESVKLHYRSDLRFVVRPDFFD